MREHTYIHLDVMDGDFRSQHIIRYACNSKLKKLYRIRYLMSI